MVHFSVSKNQGLSIKEWGSNKSDYSLLPGMVKLKNTIRWFGKLSDSVWGLLSCQTHNGKLYFLMCFIQSDLFSLHYKYLITWEILWFPAFLISWYPIPSWSMTPGPVLLCPFVCANKSDPLVDQVELKEVNLTYAHVQHVDGQESTVFLLNLAPCPHTPVAVDSIDAADVSQTNIAEVDNEISTEPDPGLPLHHSSN